MLGVNKMTSNTICENTLTENSQQHELQNHWVYWAHLPHDTKWTIESYKKIYKMKTVEESLVISETITDEMVTNCMLFIMKDGIHPTWEDEKNRRGGCFSYKISNKNVVNVWKKLMYVLVGETLTSNENLLKKINGITISPKKYFCIVKIWLSSCEFQDPSLIANIKGLSSRGCLFKKHCPEK